MFMDDAVNVHPVEHGLCLCRLDGMHVNFLSSVSQCEDGWAVAYILLQGGPETRAQTVTFLMVSFGQVLCMDDLFHLAAAHSVTVAERQLDTVVRSVVTVETTDL